MAKQQQHDAQGRFVLGAPSAKAVTPTTIVVQQLLGSDPALEQAAAIAAKPVLDAVRYPGLQRAKQLETEAQQEAARAILAAQSK